MNAQLRYVVYRFVTAGFVLIEKVRLLLDEDEQCTLRNLELKAGVSHFTSVLDEIEEALRSLSESEATREFATVHIKHFREMRRSFIRFLTPENWDGSAWQQVCLEVEANAELREAAASDWSLAGEYTRFVEGITSRVLKGFPEQLVCAESVKLLPAMLEPVFSLAQKISEFHRQSQVLPLPEFNVAEQQYLFVKERITELTECVEACQLWQPRPSGLFPVSISYRTEPTWWLFDFRNRVLDWLRELSLDARSETTAMEKPSATDKELQGHQALPSSCPLLDPNQPASNQIKPTPDLSTSTEPGPPKAGIPTADVVTRSVPETSKDQRSATEPNLDQFSWSETVNGFILCGIKVSLKSQKQMNVLRRLCRTDKGLSIDDLISDGQDEPESEVNGFKSMISRIRRQIVSAFDSTGDGDPIPTAFSNQKGSWSLDKKLLLKWANSLRKDDHISDEKEPCTPQPSC